jgi:hypothetical protein
VTTPAPNRSIQTQAGRGRLRTLVRRATLLVALVSILAACSDDRPLKYLRSQPEDSLAFPGAELTCTRGRDSAVGLSSTEPATSERCYTASATEDEVVAWYAEELASRGWRREGQNLPALSRLIPKWDKGFVNLGLRDFLQAPGGIPILEVTYSVVTEVRHTGYDESPIARLESLPEASLAFPASTDPSPRRHGRTTTSNSIHPAWVEGGYRTVASTDEIVRFYEAELAARDWQPIDISEAHNGIGTLPARAWKKGDVVAHVTANPTRAGNPPTLGYRFRIIEVLGPEQVPGFPWR